MVAVVVTDLFPSACIIIISSSRSWTSAMAVSGLLGHLSTCRVWGHSTQWPLMTLPL